MRLAGLLLGLLAQGAWGQPSVQAGARPPRLLFRQHRWAEHGRVGVDFSRPGAGDGSSARRRLLEASSPASLEELRFERLHRHAGVEAVEVPRGVEMTALLAALREHPDVEFAEEDKVLSAYGKPNDPNLPDQWALYRLGLWLPTRLQSGAVNAPAWSRTEGSPSVTVCVIDSGIDYTHPDLLANIWTNSREIPGNGIDDDGNGYVDDIHGYNFLTNSGDPMDNNFHGTHLAGMVGAMCNNNLGICGVNPSVKLMGCKFLDSNGNGYTSDAVRCLEYSLANAADVTLNSYGGLYADSAALQAAIEAADQKGQLFVTAAGNDYGTDIDKTPTYPAAYPNTNIVSVISTNESNLLANYSNFGAKNAHLAAPGSHILSTILDGKYGLHEGTSQSAGYVAGAAALLLAAYRAAGQPGLKGAQTRDALFRGVTPAPGLQGKCTTGGLLDVGRAMALVPTQTVAKEAKGAELLTTDLAQLNTQPLTLPTYSGLGPPVDTVSLQAQSEGERTVAVGDPRGGHTLPLRGPLRARIDGNYLVQFRSGDGMAGSSLLLTPAAPGPALVGCQLGGMAQPYSDPRLGAALPESLPAEGCTIDLQLQEADGPLMVAGFATRAVSVQRGGSVQLLGSFPGNFSGNSPSSPAPSPSAASNGSHPAGQLEPLVRVLPEGLEGTAPGPWQVSALLHPDRLAVSFYAAANTSAPAAQLELFTRAGHFQPAGSLRLTWLNAAGELQGVVGMGNNPPGEAGLAHPAADLQTCIQPPQAVIIPARLTATVEKALPLPQHATSPAATSAAVLPAAPGPASTSPSVQPLSLAISNRGGVPLVVHASVEQGSANSLDPSLWQQAHAQQRQQQGTRLAPAAGGASAAGLASCSSGAQGPCAAFEALRGQQGPSSSASSALEDTAEAERREGALELPVEGVAAAPEAAAADAESWSLRVRGNPTDALRYRAPLRAPFWVRGEVERGASCSNQLLSVTDSAAGPGAAGAKAVTLGFSCGAKYLAAPPQSPLGGEAQGACADYGPDHFSVFFEPDAMAFADDQCRPLSTSHELPPGGPLYLFIGANCTQEACPEGALWRRLEVEQVHDVAAFSSSSSSGSSSSLSAAAPPPMDQRNLALDMEAPGPVPSSDAGERGPAGGDTVLSWRGSGLPGEAAVLAEPEGGQPGRGAGGQAGAGAGAAPHEGQSQEGSKGMGGDPEAGAGRRHLASWQPQRRRLGRSLAGAGDEQAPSPGPASAAAGFDWFAGLPPESHPSGVKRVRAANRVAADQAAWSRPEPSNLAVPPGERRNITLHISADQLGPGMNRASVVLKLSDPQQPTLRVPLDVLVA